MWFNFGIFTALIVLTVRLQQKLKVKSALQLRRIDLIPIGKEYKFDFIPETDNQPAYGYLEVPCVTSLQFSAKFEHQYDKWAKKLGISHEFEIGVPEFDDIIYLTCVTEDDAQQLGKCLEVSQLIEKCLSGLVGSRGGDHLSNELICDGKVLYLKIAYRGKADYFNVDFRSVKLPLLQSLAKELIFFECQTPHFWKVPSQRNSAILLAVSSSLAIWGCIDFARLWFEGNQLFDPWAFAKFAVLIGLVGLCACIFCLFKFVKKSARRHLVLFEVSLSGFLGLILSSYGLLYDANIDFDTSVAEKQRHEVVHKYTEYHKTKRSGYYTYHIRLKRSVPPIGANMKISANLYNQVSEGGVVEVSLRRGFFNQPWLENVMLCVNCLGSE